MAVRSLCNGWATSYRYHEAILLPCVFGCNLMCPINLNADMPRDEFKHYLGCPILWRIVADITGERNADIPTRLGVGRGGGVLSIIVAHHVYHFIRMSKRAEILAMRSRRQMEHLQTSAFNFGQAAYRDM